MFFEGRFISVKSKIPEGAKRPFKAVLGFGLSTVSSCLRRGYHPDHTILTTSTPRSGSTWLMNLIETLPGSCPIFEPLHPGYRPQMEKIDDQYYPRLLPDEDAAEFAAYLTQVFSGKTFTRWSSNHATFHSFLSAQRFVVKFVHANRCWGWMANHYANNKKIVLLRHPCAVVESMLRSPGRWQGWSREEVLGPLRLAFDDAFVSEISRRAPNHVGMLAASWAADALLPICETTPESSLLISHEELVANPDGALTRLFAYLEEDVPAKARERYDVPSNTTNMKMKMANLKGVRRLESWKKRLDGEAAREILDVVRLFGIDFYDDSPEPDYRKMDEMHRTQTSPAECVIG
ncbi:MAG: sulfotransferase [Pirellulales bacterium]|nr:sulfotransferase [Pirellulales bacterium]